jgi:ABC-2 type transport system permease protein
MSSVSESTLVRPRPGLAAWSLCQREIVRFFRQRNRIIGAIGQPILFWLLFGAGMNRWFHVDGQNFSLYYFPGTLLLILLFTAIFTTISIIEDRREGFLQSVLVAPIPRWSMVLGKVLGGSLIALAQGLVFLVLALTLGVRFGAVTALAIGLFMSLVALALTCLGFVLAWRMDSTQGFHAIMNLLLMPMWLLSGAFFPVPAPGSQSSWVEIVLHWIMRLNPVTYGVAGLRRMIFVDIPNSPLAAGGDFQPSSWVPQLSTCWFVMLIFSVVTFVAAWRIAGGHTTGDLL